MTLKHLIATAACAIGLTAGTAAQAYDIRMTGQTRASRQLAIDVLNTIASYSKATGGCRFVFSADTRVAPGYYPPVSATARIKGGHYERWVVNVCARKQMFEVGMWDSPRGGTDFVVVPVTRPLPLHAL